MTSMRPASESAKRGINFGEYVEQALDAAASGAGLVLGRKVLVSKDIEDGRLLCPFGPELSTGLRWQIVCRKEVRHTPVAVAFQSWVAQELEKSMAMDCAPKPVV